MYARTVLGHTDAQRLVDHVVAALEPEGRGAAVAVVDAYGELLAFLRTDGCRLSSGTIAINKAYTAAREQTESRAVGVSGLPEDDDVELARAAAALLSAS